MFEELARGLTNMGSEGEKIVGEEALPFAQLLTPRFEMRATGLLFLKGVEQ